MSIRNIKEQVRDHGLLTEQHTQWLLQQAQADTSHKDGKLHPSSISGCPTAAAFNILGFTLGGVMHDATVQRIFDLGHAVHQMLQYQYHKAGLLSVDIKGKPLVEVPLAIPEYDLVGHADGILDKKVYGQPAVLEIKSINSNALLKLNAPKEEHKLQAACYVMALAKIIDGSRIVIFVYYGKNDSKIKEFKYTVTDTDVQRVEDRVKLIKELVAKFVEEGIVPPPYFDNPNNIPCRYCGWQSACHDTLHRDGWLKAIKEKYYVPSQTAKKVTDKKPAPKKPAPKRKLPPKLKKRGS